MSTFFGLSWHRLCDMSSPAFENSCSDGTEEPGIA